MTYGLLLQPHLTSCCGKHLSQEATTRIQREGGACPLCKTPHWSTVLNKHFQRQVNALHVFCRHEDRGCGWHGELSDLECHIQSCPQKDDPLMTELIAKVETSTGMHLKEIEYLIERYSVVQDYYKQHINSVLEKEQSLINQKSASKTQLRCERDELSRNGSELSSAEGRLNDAQRKRRNANTVKAITGASAGLLTLVTIATLGAAAPVTVPLAVGAVRGAVAFDQVEKDAQKDIERCHSRINDTQRKISQIKSNISSLSSEISTLNIQKSRCLNQRNSLQEEKGKMKKSHCLLTRCPTLWQPALYRSHSTHWKLDKKS